MPLSSDDRGALKARVPTTGLRGRIDPAAQRRSRGQRTGGGPPILEGSSRRDPWDPPVDNPLRPYNSPLSSARSGGFQTRPDAAPGQLGPPLSQSASQVGMVRSGRDPISSQRTQYVGGRPGAVRYTSSPFRGQLSSAGVPIGEMSEAAPGSYSPSSKPYDYARSLGQQYGADQSEEAQERLRSYLGGLGFRAGGGVPGSSDTVPAWLTPNEFVVPREHADQIRTASGPALGNALSQLAVDIKTGQPPGNRPVGGREDFSMGGMVRDKNQPGYALGGGVHGVLGELGTRRQERPPSKPRFSWQSYPGQGDAKRYRDANERRERSRSLTGDRLRGYAESQGYDPDALSDYMSKNPGSYLTEGGGLVGAGDRRHISTDPGFHGFQSRRRQDAEEAKAAASRQAMEEGWASQSQMNQQRKAAAIERGGNLRREIGEFAREEHSVNTAMAARAALAGSSIQPVEASLSNASRLQLRSSLQGALLEASAKIEAEKMSYQAEVDAISNEMQIMQQRINAEQNQETRSELLAQQEEQNRQRIFFEDRAADAALRMQKASDPGFLKSIAPSLITGGMALLGNMFLPGVGGILGGMAGNAAGRGLFGNAAHSAVPAMHAGTGSSQSTNIWGQQPSGGYTGSV